MDDLSTIKAAVELVLGLDKVLSDNGFCGITHDGERKYLQSMDCGLIKIIKKNNLPFSLKKGDRDECLMLTCDLVKSYAITTADRAVALKLVTRSRLKQLLQV